MSRKLCHFIWGIWWFHSLGQISKDFEVMKVGKSAIRPWLSCQYIENTLVDRPSSVIDFHIFQEILMNFMALKSLIQRQTKPTFFTLLFPQLSTRACCGLPVEYLKRRKKNRRIVWQRHSVLWYEADSSLKVSYQHVLAISDLEVLTWH